MQGLPDRTVRRGEQSVSQYPGLRSLRHPEENRLLRRRPPLLHGDLRLHSRGMHLCAAAGEEAEEEQPEPAEERA